MDTLSKLFGSETRVKILRLFLFNQNNVYDLVEIAERAQVHKYAVKHEIKMLKKISLIKQKNFLKEITYRRKRKILYKKRRIVGWMLNDKFSYLRPLQNLLIDTLRINNDSVVKRLQRIGKVKLLILSGVFINNDDSRVDIFIVADNIRKNVLYKIVKDIEAEIGKEIRYTALETVDFHYRLGMYDKLVRDVLDFPHEKIVNRMGAFV